MSTVTLVSRLNVCSFLQLYNIFPLYESARFKYKSSVIELDRKGHGLREHQAHLLECTLLKRYSLSFALRTSGLKQNELFRFCLASHASEKYSSNNSSPRILACVKAKPY